MFMGLRSLAKGELPLTVPFISTGAAPTTTNGG